MKALCSRWWQITDMCCVAVVVTSTEKAPSFFHTFLPRTIVNSCTTELNVLTHDPAAHC